MVQDPQKAKGVLGASAGLFQVRLLEAYLALPNPNAFASEHQDLSRLCTRAFRGTLSAVATGGSGAPSLSLSLKPPAPGHSPSAGAMGVRSPPNPT